LLYLLYLLYLCTSKLQAPDARLTGFTNKKIAIIDANAAGRGSVGRVVKLVVKLVVQRDLLVLLTQKLQKDASFTVEKKEGEKKEKVKVLYYYLYYYLYY
jgi:hypothetical protein